MRSVRRPIRWAVAPLLLAAALGCRGKPALTTGTAPEAPAGPPWFQDVTDELGLDFVHDPGPDGSYFMPQAVGSGCALFDADGDGRLDVLLLQNAGPRSESRNRLYLQQPDGKFKDASPGSGLDFAGHNMGAAVGDVNNDGKPDVLVTEFRGARLFLGRGGGRFVEMTRDTGIDNPLWGTSAAFFDYDRDGWLDLVVTNYVDYDPEARCSARDGRPEFCAPKVFPGTATKLFRNKGFLVERAWAGFEDVTRAAGVGSVVGPGLGVICADLTGDGWPDVFVANDGQPNRLWVNQKNGTFVEEAVSRGVALTGTGQAFAGMGVACGDVDGDLLLDLYVTHLASEMNTLWKQGPRGSFADQTVGSGLAAPRWRGTGWGTLMADFDHDGRLDLAIVNGRVERGTPADGTGLPAYWQPYAERNQVFANAGGGRFRDVSPGNPDFCGRANVGRGLACGDIDGDGAPDLLVTATRGRARLYRNVAPERGNWLKVRAVDPTLNRDAYGAEVTVKAGDKSWVRLVNPADSFLSSSSPVAHFGLGGTPGYDGVAVVWPDGTREEFPGGPADQTVELRKGEGRLTGAGGAG